MVATTIESVVSSRDLPAARRAITGSPLAGLQSGWWHVVRPASRTPRHALIEAQQA